MTDVDPDESRPRRRKPLVTGSGWLLFVCVFLPALRVCGDPAAPIEFPPVYVAYAGGLVLGGLALATALAARRVWFTVWFLLWYATAVAVVAISFGNTDDVAGLVIAAVGLVCAFVVIPAFHRRRFVERGFWIGGLVQGIASLAWCLLIALDPEAMWGAFVSTFAAAALVGASFLALTDELRERRERRHPAPLPVARIV